MQKSTRARQVIALVAAYLIALQALLLPLSVAASPFAGSQCTTASSADGRGAPVHSQSGCPCAAGCGTQCSLHHALAAPPTFVVARSDVYATAFRAQPVLTHVIRTPERRPQIPRAPPHA